MTLVTLTDHNSIDGALEMLDAGLPDVFISAEMTTTFPEDGCNIHITIANVTPEQFNEANRLRKNIYEMVAYLDLQIAEEHRNPSGKQAHLFHDPSADEHAKPALWKRGLADARAHREGDSALQHLRDTERRADKSAERPDRPGS